MLSYKRSYAKYEEYSIRIDMTTARVRQFTEESMGVTLPKRARPFTKEEYVFLTRMVMSELWEGMLTVADSNGHASELMAQCLQTIDRHSGYTNTDSVVYNVSEQADALVDSIYYMHNAAAKAGIDLDPFFDEVHAANLRKRWPDGTYHRRADGKVVKPEGWTPPDVLSVAMHQV
jgi:predicted HAD superfamily Cof-like phosphohydrolase